MSNFMIVLEFTVQTLYTCLGTKESNRLCTKTVYGSVSEKFYKVEFTAGHRTPHYRKTEENGGKYQRNVVSQRGCPFRGRKG